MTKPGFLFRGACLLLAVCLTGCGVHNPITGNKGWDGGVRRYPGTGRNIRLQGSPGRGF